MTFGQLLYLLAGMGVMTLGIVVLLALHLWGLRLARKAARNTEGEDKDE